eukprot:jgi/Botrbrau1/13295/Bobra.27_2s0015.1
MLSQPLLPPPGLRVLTYNILADHTLPPTIARSVLFSYCPQRYIDPMLPPHLGTAGDTGLPC